MDDDLAQSSVAAFRSAAERLGVDPYRLARFLGDGRLAELLEALGRPQLDSPRRVLGLAESYLEFLEHEIAIQGGARPNGAKDRAP